MSIEAAIDNTALKVAGITGIKRAYGSSAYDAAVAVMTEDIPDTPVALVLLGSGDIGAGNFERLSYRLDVHVYFAGTNAGAMYKALAVFPSRFVAAWRTGRNLDGAVVDSNLTGWNAPIPVEVNGKPFVDLVLSVQVLELSGRTYSADG